MASRSKNKRQPLKSTESKILMALPVLGIAITGSILLSRSHAATTAVSAEAENGSVTLPAVSFSDTAASGGRAIRFNPSQPTTKYRDGTYSAQGCNAVPGGTQCIGVTLTIANDTVNDSSITPQATDSTSQYYENLFISNYKQYVTAKPLATLNLSRVSNASLTTYMFNSAATKIRTQAATGQ